MRNTIFHQYDSRPTTREDVERMNLMPNHRRRVLAAIEEREATEARTNGN